MSPATRAHGAGEHTGGSAVGPMCRRSRFTGAVYVFVDDIGSTGRTIDDGVLFRQVQHECEDARLLTDGTFEACLT